MSIPGTYHTKGFKRGISQVKTKFNGSAEDGSSRRNQTLFNVGFPGSDWVSDLHTCFPGKPLTFWECLCMEASP